MRIVQVSVFTDPLGREPDELLYAWPTLGAVAQAVSCEGFDVTVVQAAGRNAHFERGGVAFRFVRERRPGPLRRRAGLWASPLTPSVTEAVSRARPQLIHFQSLSFPRHVRRLRERFTDTPILLQDHGDRPPSRRQRLLERRGMPRVQGVSFVHGEQASPFVNAGVFSADTPVFEVPESSSSFRPGDRAEARAATGLEGDPCLLWVARLDRNKDPLTVLEAVALAAAELPDLRLWCCYTDAPLLDEVKAVLMASPVLAERVRLLGSVPHARVEALCRAADFFVVGSHREGSGYALMEAMACGTPPVVTDIPAFRKMTDGGRVGALFRPSDARSAARALVEAYRRDRDELRRTVLDRFASSLSFDALGRSLGGVYRTLLEGP